VTVLLTSQGTVAAANLDSVDCAFLGEAERRMLGVSFKQREILIRELPNARRQLLVAFPE
jgi:hypothetical protein